MSIIIYLCGFLFSTALCCLGFTPRTWVYWVAVVLYLALAGFIFYKEGKRR